MVLLTRGRGCNSCCACAASGHAAAAPPSRVMNSRRVMGLILRPRTDPIILAGRKGASHRRKKRLLMSESGQLRLLPRRKIGGRFSSISRPKFKLNASPEKCAKAAVRLISITCVRHEARAAICSSIFAALLDLLASSDANRATPQTQSKLPSCFSSRVALPTRPAESVRD
jgi:hypothetical protein